MGSSPLTRGKPVRLMDNPVQVGLIPAHAGKTIQTTVQTVAGWGSSPLTRGKRRLEIDGQARDGLIPAHAGKTDDPNLEDIKADGSSPLTRGKRARGDHGNPRPGLIPAHAGKTPADSIQRIAPTAHPRSRGENVQVGGHQMPSFGSSPLTRGKHPVGGAGGGGLRLIPAHAGKTEQCRRAKDNQPAHPRSRGENQGKLTTENWNQGSSPLTRGKRDVGGVGASRRGLIPAHAGKTGEREADLRGNRAHPRSRGENGSKAAPVTIAGGSSPLTRGKLTRRGTGLRDRGLIPAHAGKTRVRPGDLHERRAHPRSRGENITPRVEVRLYSGSSPLTRGKRLGRGNESRVRGLIPAHAGKTPGRTRPAPLRTAHPRSRGENRGSEELGEARQGSSPLTRGKRNRQSPHARTGRLIPAHAGKT